MHKGTFITKKPLSQELRKYINHYYFHSSDSKNDRLEFLYFPGFKNALTIYKGANVSYGNNYSVVTPQNPESIIYLYSGIQDCVRKAVIDAPFQKIGVVFKKLGLNHFLSQPLDSITHSGYNMDFDYLKGKFDYACSKAFSSIPYDEKVKALDTWFLENLNTFDPPYLKNAIDELHNLRNNYNVRMISDKLRVSSRTLNRTFKKHMNCNVKTYIKIVKFRYSLTNYLLKNRVDNLTGLALEHGYYDQSQFIRHFKSLTGMNPKKFFQKVERFGNEDTFWIIE